MQINARTKHGFRVNGYTARSKFQKPMTLLQQSGGATLLFGKLKLRIFTALVAGVGLDTRFARRASRESDGLNGPDPG
jgi:hypothetical protein